MYYYIYAILFYGGVFCVFQFLRSVSMTRTYVPFYEGVFCVFCSVYDPHIRSFYEGVFCVFCSVHDLNIRSFLRGCFLCVLQ